MASRLQVFGWKVEGITRGCVKRFLWAAAAIFMPLLILSAPAGGAPLTVIELRHRPADEIIPVLSPFLGPQDKLSGQAYLLFLSTTPENLVRIQAIIDRLDRASQQLAITVVQGENALETLASLAVSGSAALGDGITAGVGNHRGQPNESIRLDAQGIRGKLRSSDLQRVVVQDGAAATIYVGLSAPVAMGGPRYQGMQHHQVYEYREMLTGIQVTPRIAGDQVTLEIETRRDRPSGDGSGSIDTQQIQTQIHGRLNEWIEIGGIFSRTDQTETGLIHSGTVHQSNRRHVLVRVEAIPQ